MAWSFIKNLLFLLSSASTSASSYSWVVTAECFRKMLVMPIRGPMLPYLEPEVAVTRLPFHVVADDSVNSYPCHCQFYYFLLKGLYCHFLPACCPWHPIKPHGQIRFTSVDEETMLYVIYDATCVSVQLLWQDFHKLDVPWQRVVQ